MKIMNIQAYINDNKSTLIAEAKTLYDVVNAETFAKAVVNNVNEQAQEWEEEIGESDENIAAIATRYYERSIAE